MVCPQHGVLDRMCTLSQKESKKGSFLSPFYRFLRPLDQKLTVFDCLRTKKQSKKRDFEVLQFCVNPIFCLSVMGCFFNKLKNMRFTNKCTFVKNRDFVEKKDPGHSPHSGKNKGFYNHNHKSAEILAVLSKSSISAKNSVNLTLFSSHFNL